MNNSPALSTSSGSAGNPLRLVFAVIAVLAVAGILLSAVALQRHYAKSATNFCEFSQKFNCDIVNRSEYSSILGIPVAGIGVVGYGFLLFLSAFWRDLRETPLRLLVASFAGWGFALYLTYIEARVLEAWCVLCLASLAIITIIAALSIIVRVKSPNP